MNSQILYRVEGGQLHVCLDQGILGLESSPCWVWESTRLHGEWGLKTGVQPPWWLGIFQAHKVRALYPLGIGSA